MRKRLAGRSSDEKKTNLSYEKAYHVLSDPDRRQQYDQPYADLATQLLRHLLVGVEMRLSPSEDFKIKRFDSLPAMPKDSCRWRNCDSDRWYELGHVARRLLQKKDKSLDEYSVHEILRVVIGQIFESVHSTKQGDLIVQFNKEIEFHTIIKPRLVLKVEQDRKDHVVAMVTKYKRRRIEPEPVATAPIPVPPRQGLHRAHVNQFRSQHYMWKGSLTNWLYKHKKKP